MVNTIIREIGVGRDFPTLAAFADALPADLTVLDQVHVAELWADASDPGGSTINTICDATRFVIIRPAPGQGVADLMTPDGDPLAVTPGFGAMIHAVSEPAISLAGAQTRVSIRGLQILCEADSALVATGGARFMDVDGCLMDANSAGPVAELSGAGSAIRNCVLVQRGGGDGIQLSSGALAEACTIFKTARPVAEGLGVATTGSPASEARSVAAFGFGRAFSTALVNAEALASDQINQLPSPTTFANPYWTAISSLTNPADTIPGPYNVPLERVSNNLNAFARFDGGTFVSLPPGEKMSFSAIVGTPTSLNSAILLDSAAGRPELRVDWTLASPGIGLLGQTANLRALSGTVEALGSNLFRLTLIALNTTSSALDVAPTFYVTRGVQNVGLNVGMYAGAMMAGIGHLGAGFIEEATVPGTFGLAGVDPDDALTSTLSAALDLRPLAGGALDDQGRATGADLHRRPRLAPDTIGAVSLNTGPVLTPSDAVLPLVFDAGQLIDPGDVLTAKKSRTVLAAAPTRIVSPFSIPRSVAPGRDTSANGSS